MQRRTLLRLGLAGAAILAIAGTGAAWLRPGWSGGRLTERGRDVFAAVARAVLDGVLPAGEIDQRRAITAHLDRLDAAIAAFPEPTRDEISLLLALLASPPGRRGLAGLSSPWSEASVPEIQEALQSMRTSSVTLRMQAYHALRDLTNAAYFADAATWVALGYPDSERCEMTKQAFPDPIRDGLARGWKVHGGPHAAAPERLDVDVAIVGSGAGAGITAEVLVRAGLRVAIVEEGPLRSTHDFHQRESEAYPSLYQESAGRKTADKAITILQGRCVGGSTTVNWTSSFRTPSATLAFWRKHHGLEDFTDDALAPWFAQVESRLSIAPWLTPPNENNELLRRGAGKLGIAAAVISRNVKGCLNLGSCGMGCPTNAKQSMLVTTLPAALDAGAVMLVQTRAQRLEMKGDAVAALHCAPAEGHGPGTRITARHYVVAGGAINSPALLMRSGLPDPHALLGTRTFLHPVVVSAATFPQRVEGWDGAPQTIYSDHFLDTQPIDGPIGYKLEAPPLHPLIFAITLPGYGREQAKTLAQFPHTHSVLALLRDGFHAESPGGRVTLRGDGSPVLDYPLNDFVMEGARRALLSMAEIQFAAGALTVRPGHELAASMTSWPQARAAIAALPMKPLLTRVVSAHVMGGCGMSADTKLGVVRPDAVHWQVPNLSVHDGSIFPTSIGANPQLSIYGIVARLAHGLARRLGGADVRLA